MKKYVLAILLIAASAAQAYTPVTTPGFIFRTDASGAVNGIVSPAGALATLGSSPVVTPAGTATSPPLQIPTGTLTTVPQSGAIENNGTDLFYTDGGVRRRVTTVPYTMPTIASGFGTAPTIQGANVSGFAIFVGTSPTGTGTLTLPTSPYGNGWICRGTDITNHATIIVQQSSDTVSSVSLDAYGMTTGAPTNYVAGDELNVTCTPY